MVEGDAVYLMTGNRLRLFLVLTAAVLGLPFPPDITLVGAGVLATLPPPACVACQVDVERARHAYSSDEWKALTAGEVVTPDATASDSSETRAGTVQAAGIVRHPPPLVWATLVDFASRPKFQPNTREVRIVKVDGNRVWLAEHLRFFLVDVRYTVINTLDPEHGTVSWALDESVDHDIAGTSGAWQLTPVADGRHTLLTYRAWIDTGRRLPGFVERFLLQRSLPNVIGGLRDEIERRCHDPDPK